MLQASQAASVHRTIEFELGKRGRFAPAFLAAAFLRFQGVEFEEEGVEKLHYMHMNPLKRKLVEHPQDWPWSSFSFHSNSQHGLIRVDPVR